MAVVFATLLCAAGLLGYDASIRTEARSGSTLPGYSSPTLQVDALVAGETSIAGTQFTLAYFPHLLTPFGQGGQPLELLHNGRAAASWSPVRGTRLVLQESLSLGHNDFSPLLGTSLGAPPPPVNPLLPEVISVAYLSSATSLLVEQIFSRQLLVTASAAFLVSGGASASARKYLPIQRGPHLSARLAWRMSREDALVVSALGSSDRFSSSTTATLGSLTGGLRHELDPATSAELHAGFSLGNTAGASTPFPVVSAQLSRRFALREGNLGGRLRAALTPSVDRLTGGIYQLLDSSADLDWQIVSGLRVGARGAFGRGLSGSAENGTQLTQAEGSASLALVAGLALSAGVRGAWQRDSGPPAPSLPPFLWTAFFSVAASEHGKL